MSQPIRFGFQTLLERLRGRFGQRAVAIVLALLLEGLLGIMLLTLGTSIVRREDAQMTTFAFSVDKEPNPDPAPAPAESKAEDTPPAKQVAQPEQVAKPEETPQEPAPSPPVLLELSKDQLAAVDITNMRPAPRPNAQGPIAMGPPNTGAVGDTPRVDGSGPNGEPLYAASWYREPYPDELRGYLSTARGPGWGLIACRTVQDFRVEDCVAVGEYPQGSNITRSVLAAAWQFRVRPPRVGGRLKIGEWVRIRIDYDIRR